MRSRNPKSSPHADFKYSARSSASEIWLAAQKMVSSDLFMGAGSLFQFIFSLRNSATNAAGELCHRSDSLKEPCLCVAPLPLNRSFRYLQCFRDFCFTEAGKETQLYDFRPLR